ncbi:MAG: hypothetical protein ABWJ63_05645 [Thermus sp.]|uniref:hypothetical protein n=1 Tax=Thermus sp. TaxID=275 RepID=UPI00351AEDA2
MNLSLHLAQSVAPLTPTGRRGRPWRYPHALYLVLLKLFPCPRRWRRTLPTLR